VIAGTEAIPITEPVARLHAELGAQLADSGTPIGLHDLWIGATALVYGFGVATQNKSDFSRIPGLRILSPANSTS
jgi:predicted nucleic acid-binding protein